MISFVTCIKLMPDYADYAVRLQEYMESISPSYPYEIIVVEDVCSKNVAFVSDTITPEFFALHHARLIRYDAAYANPHGYNMIEAFAKNVGIRAAKYEYVCVTNCDILFDAEFFKLIPVPNTFYRFLTYEGETLLNPSLLHESTWTLRTVSHKSGDIMLMHSDIWKRIRGYPENEIWVHSDLIVCKVVHNNGVVLNVPQHVKIQTHPQIRTRQSTAFELDATYAYYDAGVCNLH